MATLNESANAVLMEFGGVVPDELLSLEDARREFLYVRSLAMQKMAIADTDKTVSSTSLNVTQRDGVMPDSNIIPAFVEYLPNNPIYGDEEQRRVLIVPADDIPNYEGSRAIAFYGSPLRFRLAWNVWEFGTLKLYFDPVEDISDISGEDEVPFPVQFHTMLVKQTALKLTDIIKLKLTMLDRWEEKDRSERLLGVLGGIETKLLLQIADWENEYKRWINKDQNEGPILRRSNEEIMARGYNDIGGWQRPPFLSR
ncbi:MAG: hypothetical protein KF855_03405 [Acidobacteria bacterium]|nr:hypothetical protein [Acidobacteriota bacterium]